MKKLTTLLLSLLMILSLAACNKTDPTDASAVSTDVETQVPYEIDAITELDATAEETTDAEETPKATVSPDGLTYADTKTGKFFKNFSDGKIYMEYEMRMVEIGVVSVITATDGEKTYASMDIPDMGKTESISDKDYIYTIDNQNKMIYKQPMSDVTSADTEVSTVINEDNVDMANFKTGTYTVDSTTYETEEFAVDGATCIVCLDGDKIAYMITTDGESEVFMKVIEISDHVDEKLFEMPEGYQVLEVPSAN